MGQDRKAERFADYVAKLNIVPVSISYEFDPCDRMKANELCEKASAGEYRKSEQEDVKSIATGIAGQKGLVHVAFGRPLAGDFADADSVAAALDEQIVGNYVLHPTNFFAYKARYGDYPEAPCSSRQEAFQPQQHEEEERRFLARVAECPEEQRPFLLDMYANPVLNRQQVLQSGS
jgi:hypothetical protein